MRVENAGNSVTLEILHFGADGKLRHDDFRYDAADLPLMEEFALMHYVTLDGGKPLKKFEILSSRAAKKRNPTKYKLIEKACGGTLYADKSPRQKLAARHARS